MAVARRPAVLLAVVALCVALLGQGAPQFRFSQPVRAATTPFFSNVLPDRILAGDSSHNGDEIGTGAANADPPTRVGYCVEAGGPGIAFSGGTLGFTVATRTGTFMAAAPGAVETADFFEGLVGDSTDDVYCAVITAPAATDPMYDFVVVQWTYDDGTLPVKTIELDIEAVNLTLVGTDGVIGGRALICTAGWDPTFMTGFASNNPVAPPPPPPNPLDQVAAGDWSWLAAENPQDITMLGAPFKDGDEWCIALASPTQHPNFNVTLDFDTVYATGTVSDDQSHALLAPEVASILAEPNFSELRHATLGGQLVEEQDASENVVGSIHTACVVPSDSDDILLANDIQFSGTGPDGGANVANLTVFHALGMPGVPDGTLCFSWTSTKPGEQFVNLRFTKVGGAFPGVRNVGWDSDGSAGVSNGALLKQWNTIDRTEITSGADPRDGGETLTGKSFTAEATFQAGDGTFSVGTITLFEWVIGSHTGSTGPITNVLLDGVVLKVKIRAGSCGGHFVSEANSAINLGTEISGVSLGGRFDRVDLPGGDPAADDPLGDGPDDIRVSIDGDGGCVPGATLTVDIDAFYPGSTVSFGTESTTIGFTFSVGMKTPRVAWAGQTVTISDYAFSYSGSCPNSAALSTVHFVRPKGQPGGFVGGTGISVISPDHATQLLGADCAASIAYESEMPGEVDIEVFIDGNPYSKVAFPIFFLALEDVELTASTSLIVSSRGDLSAEVRGWFIGNNKSGRTAETKADGRQVPADRWILPTDWETLRGNPDHRPNWPTSPNMPVTQVTFEIENEAVVNNYRTGATGGGAGWFLLDGTESSINVNPRTGKASVLGAVERPRIITDDTDPDGIATVDTFGDFNLTFEGCAKSPVNGSARCKVNDLAGSTGYIAIADYPQNKGPLPPAFSNKATTTWHWAGYKEVTVVDTDSPSIKYVVAHLKDRDGYCDARAFNNELGVPVRFQIDAGGGMIINVEGAPFAIDESRRGATTTTYDTLDDRNAPLNTDIAKPTLASDECQAWIKITNSMLTPTNVLVTFPAPPAPVPGEVRITAVSCVGPESITIKNVGTKTVSLAGFSLRSRPTQPLNPEEYLGLYGLLAPGESRVVDAGPGAPIMGWLDSQAEIFVDGDPTDYARLVWNEFEVNRMNCSGVTVNPHIPPTLPLDPEGEIVVDITIDFGAQENTPLTAGWNLVTAGRDGSIAGALAGNEAEVAAIYAWDAGARAWKRYSPSGPQYLNTMDSFRAGQVYWVEVKRPFTLYLPK